jgi:hypothetical protein
VILIHSVTDVYAVPVLGVQHLEASAMQLNLATRPTNLTAAYLPPTRTTIESDMTKCVSGVFPVLMAGAFNAKHIDWNSRPTTARDTILRDYANINSCLISRPDSPTTTLYTHNMTPVHPGYLTVCSAFGSDRS